jgi:hypothetical protein
MEDTNGFIMKLEENLNLHSCIYVLKLLQKNLDFDMPPFLLARFHLYSCRVCMNIGMILEIDSYNF